MAYSPAPGTPLSSSFQYGEQTAKLLRSLKTSLDKWKLDVKSGMKVVEAICELKRDKEESNFDKTLEMQDHCSELAGTCDRLRERMDNIGRVSDKLDSLAKLNIEDAKVAEAARTILLCYGEQCDMDRVVAEKVGLLSSLAASEDELVFHSAVWIHQPAIDDRCDISEIMIEHFLEQMHDGSDPQTYY
jgi:hypothetical protein